MIFECLVHDSEGVSYSNSEVNSQLEVGVVIFRAVRTLLSSGDALVCCISGESKVDFMRW